MADFSDLQNENILDADNRVTGGFRKTHSENASSYWQCRVQSNIDG